MKIESLPDIPWNAHAAIHRALEQIPMEGKAICIWYDEETRTTRYCSSGSNFELAALCVSASNLLMNG